MGKDNKNDTAIFAAYEDTIPWDPATPEKNLLRALLITAMADLKKNGEVGRRAKEYFLSYDSEYLFSFRSVCDYLEIDPQTILSKIGLLNATPKHNIRDSESVGERII